MFEWRPQELVGQALRHNGGGHGAPITPLLLLHFCFISTLLQERVEIIPVGQADACSLRPQPPSPEGEAAQE